MSNVGIALGNGSKQYVDAVLLTLTMPDGKVLHLEQPGPGFIAGRVDPLIVPLPAGATISFPIDLEHCTASTEKIWKLDFPPGSYTLQAQYTGKSVAAAEANLDVKGIAPMPFWKGSAQSPPVVFTVP